MTFLSGRFAAILSRYCDVARVFARLAFLLLALSTAVADAHDDATLDAMPAPHGGQLRMAGRYHLELVLEPSRLRLFFMSHANQDVEAPAGPVIAKLGSGGAERTVPLEPIGESVFGANGDFPFVAGMAVEVTVERGEAAPLVARFAPRGYAAKRPTTSE